VPGADIGDGDGRRDFDFLFGRWTVTNRKLLNPLDPASDDWVDFVAHVVTKPVLGGLGNIDLYRVPDFPRHPDFEALALRLFEPNTTTWRIWWASTAAPGTIDTPVSGRFVDRTGRFECDDVIEGRAVRVRYEWTGTTANAPRWEQSFSFDEGTSWTTNWTMVWHREGAEAS
jgi:hypothetical protein